MKRRKIEVYRWSVNTSAASYYCGSFLVAVRHLNRHPLNTSLRTCSPSSILLLAFIKATTLRFRRDGLFTLFFRFQSTPHAQCLDFAYLHLIASMDHADALDRMVFNFCRLRDTTICVLGFDPTQIVGFVSISTFRSRLTFAVTNHLYYSYTLAPCIPLASTLLMTICEIVFYLSSRLTPKLYLGLSMCKAVLWIFVILLISEMWFFLGVMWYVFFSTTFLSCGSRGKKLGEETMKEGDNRNRSQGCRS